MTIDSWLQAAIADVERRGLPEARSGLEALARSTAALRAADFNEHADGRPGGAPSSAGGPSGAGGRGPR